MGNHVCHHISSPKGTGVVHHITGHEGPEGEQMCSSILSLTSAPDGMDSQPHAHANLSPPKGPSSKRAAGWVGPRAGLDMCGKSRPQRLHLRNKANLGLQISTGGTALTVERLLPYCCLLVTHEPLTLLKM